MSVHVYMYMQRIKYKYIGYKKNESVKSTIHAYLFLPN